MLYRTKLNKNNSPIICLKTGTQTKSYPLLREAATTIYNLNLLLQKATTPIKNQKIKTNQNCNI
jgi:hypothetical protein